MGSVHSMQNNLNQKTVNPIHLRNKTPTGKKTRVLIFSNEELGISPCWSFRDSSKGQDRLLQLQILKL